MRILVTGGAGFIGSHAVDAFIAAGHDVAVVDNLWPQGGGRHANVNGRASFHEIDIRSPGIGEVFAALRPDVVAHFAAQHSVAISTADPQYDADVNVKGLLNLIAFAIEHRVRKILYASSAATYGPPQRLPIDELHPQAPQSPYGISKMVGEHYLRYFAQSAGLRFTAFRYGNVYGPRQDPNGEAGVIAIFCGRMLAAQPIRIDWDGEQRKDFVFVGDVVRANLLALQSADDAVINIGTGVGTSVNRLHELIAAQLGRDVSVERAPMRPGDVRESVFAIAKARAELGWAPQTPLGDGIRRTLAFFEQAAQASA